MTAAFACRDCGVGTSEIDEYYMVHGRVWTESGMGHDGHLCIGCLEARFGRRLRRADFTDAPINVDSHWSLPGCESVEHRRSSRFKDRLAIGVLV